MTGRDILVSRARKLYLINEPLTDLMTFRHFKILRAQWLAEARRLARPVGLDGDVMREEEASYEDVED